MSDRDYGHGPEPLTATERGRLRRTVDSAALERWLVATSGVYRRIVVAHFAEEVTGDDLRASYRDIPATAEELAELETSLEEAELDRSSTEELPPLGPVHYPGRDASPGAVPFQVVPTTQYVLQLTPPDDPALRALWDAIERRD